MKPIVACTLAALALLGLYLLTSGDPGGANDLASSTRPEVVHGDEPSTLERVADDPAARMPEPPRVGEEATTDSTVLDASDDEGEVDDLTHVVGTLVLPDGRPAAGARVTIHGWTGNQERALQYGVPDDWADPSGDCDDDGRFDVAFDAPRAFQFTLDASLEGHATLGWRWGDLPRGETVDIGRHAFARTGVIVGRIQRRGGEPAGRGWRIYAESSVRPSGPDAEPTRVSEFARGTDGEFRIEGLPPGPATLSAHHTAGGWIDGPQVKVVAGEEADATIVFDGPDLGRRISILTSCRPYYVFNRPVNGRIVVRDASGSEWEAEHVKGTSQSYAVDDLPDGEYSVEIQSDVHAPWSESGVRPGQNVRARLHGTSSVALEVRDAVTGEPVQPYSLQLRFDSTTFSPSTFGVKALDDEAPAGGLYERLIPRESTLIVQSPGYARTEVPLGALALNERREVTAEMTRGTTLDVVVLRHDGVPAADAEVTLHLPHAGYDPNDVFSWPLEASKRSAFETALRTETSGADGIATFDCVTAGTWSLRVSRGTVVAVVEDVSVDGAEQSVEVRLPGAGTLRGKFDFAPGTDASGVSALVYPMDTEPPRLPWTGDGPNHTAIDAKGRFTFTDLLPGTYTVALCVPPREIPMSMNMSGYTRQVAVTVGLVEVEHGASIDAAFDAREQSPSWIELDVTMGGAPAAGLVVRANLDEGDGEIGGVLDAEGRLRLGPFLPGTWRLVLNPLSNDWKWTVPEAESLRPGQVIERRLDIGVVAGRVRIFDENSGEPKADAAVLIDESLLLYTDAEGWLETTLGVGTHQVRASIAPFAFDPKEAPNVTFEWGPEGPVVESLTLRYPAK